MPNVPFLPGVPTLSSYGANVATLLVADVFQFVSSLFVPQWGIFFAGVPVILADNVVSVDFKQEWSISNYPVEEGAFESYDKVNSPFEARVRFSAGGSIFERKALIESVNAVANSLSLFDVVTPEETYRNVNVYHYDYHRSADRGAGLIVIDVWCLEVRTSAVAAFSNTQSPSGASPVSGGAVQAQPATSDQTQAITSGGLQ
jgi:hypothetical protein